VVLGGGAATIVVVKRVVRDIDRQPYASLAAVIGVLMGVVLIALRAPLAIGPVGSVALALACLATSIAGGALVQVGGSFVAVLGTLLASLPGALVVGLVWWRAGVDTPLTTLLAELDPASRTFMVLLILACLLIAVSAWLSRALVESVVRRLSMGFEPMANLPTPTLIPRAEWSDAHRAMRASLGTSEAALRASVGTSSLPSGTVLGRYAMPAPTPAPGFAVAPSSRFSVWSFHDEVDDSFDPEIHDTPRWLHALRRVAVVVSLVLPGAAALGAGLWWYLHGQS